MVMAVVFGYATAAGRFLSCAAAVMAVAAAVVGKAGLLLVGPSIFGTTAARFIGGAEEYG
jgi:hypothetical protein